MSKCKAFIEFGDDYGDNICTMRCELEEGHEGKHKETGSMDDKFPYAVEWEGDMKYDGRTLCPKCESMKVTHDWEKTGDREDGCWCVCKECGHEFEHIYEEDSGGSESEDPVGPDQGV